MCPGAPPPVRQAPPPHHCGDQWAVETAATPLELNTQMGHPCAQVRSYLRGAQLLCRGCSSGGTDSVTANADIVGTGLPLAQWASGCRLGHVLYREHVLVSFCISLRLQPVPLYQRCHGLPYFLLQVSRVLRQELWAPVLPGNNIHLLTSRLL